MKLFTKLMLTAALTTGFAAAPTISMAGPFDVVKSQAKKEAKKEAKKQAKEKAMEMAKEQIVEKTGVSEATASTAVDVTESALEMTGVIEKEPPKDDSLMGKAMDMAKDSMKSKSEDAVMDTAKDSMSDKAEDAAMDMAKDSMKGSDMSMEHSHDGEQSHSHDPETMSHMEGQPMDSMEHKTMDKMEDSMAMEKATPKMSAPALPPVACPEGTTAQDDGTCLMTGDFEP